ncbi:hypothetical protein ACNHKD_12700 [Methylocystis sp. JAN1]|uniref:hypothetical protein n=1 Tax=Methylocystis sp. JAN1 TaxID=3397211 RepID=UPI003FA2945C
MAGPQKTVEEYIIASVRCRATSNERGRLMIAEDTVAWLGEDEKGNPKNTIYKEDAKRFKSELGARVWADKSDGQPWWFSFKPGTLRIYQVTKTVMVREVEI